MEGKRKKKENGGERRENMRECGREKKREVGNLGNEEGGRGSRILYGVLKRMEMGKERRWRDEGRIWSREEGKQK